jgi:flap endonuclease-1
LNQCGCDYTEKIEGIGPVTAFKLIKEHKDMETILAFIEQENDQKVHFIG